MSSPTIALQNISFAINGRLLVDAVSTQFYPGQLTILLGPNGAGKSSLLKLMCRQWPLAQVKTSEQPSATIEYFGKPLQQWQPAELARHLGVLPQSNHLTFNFTVQEVVELGGQALNATDRKSVV